MYNFLKKSILFLWQLPQNIVALAMWPFLGKKEFIKEEKGTRAYSCKRMRGGISLGNFIYLSEHSASKNESIAHEFGHCVQSKLLGWLYLIIIGLPSILWAIFKRKEKCYYSFYTEKWANKCAGLKVAYNGYGCYPYFPKTPIKEKNNGSMLNISNEKKEQIVESVKKQIDSNLKNKINELSKNKGA